MPMPSSAGNFISWVSNIAFPRSLEIAAARRSIIAHATQLVRDKESECVGHDILSLMIAENKKSDGRLAERELVNQVMTFLLAGHETTASVVFIFVLFLVNSRQHGDYIFLLSIRTFNNSYVAKYNICTISHSNRLNLVDTWITFAKKCCVITHQVSVLN